MPKTNNQPAKFQGFDVPNYTPVPDALFDELLTELSGAEMRVLLYIIRRTFGFKKGSDNISLSQMLNGITTQDGRILDKGVGLSKKTLLAAINTLEEREIIITERRRSREKGDEPTSYRLNIRTSLAESNGGEEKSTPPLGEKVHQGGGVKTTPSPRGKNYTTQETVLQETVKQEIYPSNIRKAKSDEFDFGKLHSTGEEPEARPPSSAENGEISQNPQPDKTEAAVSLNNAGQTQIRTIEELEGIEKFRRSAAKRSGNNAPEEEPKRRGGLAHIGQTLHGRLLVVTPAVDDTVAREAIESYIRDIAAKLHDEAPLKSSTSRAFNLYRQAGVDLNVLFNLFYDAEKEANRRSATIKKLTSMGFKNRMAYFFAVLEDKLGVRHQSRSTLSTT
jgi:hypothetical protein